jgi:hypothetical protein
MAEQQARQRVVEPHNNKHQRPEGKIVIAYISKMRHGGYRIHVESTGSHMSDSCTTRTLCGAKFAARRIARHLRKAESFSPNTIAMEV